MAFRVPLLTFRIHRFEAAIALLAMVAVTVGTAMILQRIEGVAIPAECTHQGDPTCMAAFSAFYGVQEQADWLRGVVPKGLAVAVGLLLGAPIVSRELELGTAWLSWSLSARRLTWFLHRSLPLLALLLTGLVAVAVLASQLQAASTWREMPPTLQGLGSHGPTLVANGFMTFGLAALVGSMTGRTLSAFVVGGVLSGLLVVAGSAALQTGLGDELSVWRYETYDATTGEFKSDRVLWSDELYFEFEGATYDEEALYETINPVGDFDEWMAANVARVRRVLPQDTYGTIENTQAGAAAIVGLVALVGAVFVVGRRRPT